MKTSQRDANGLTPQQANIWRVLADGEWHSREELMRAIDDDRKVLGVAVARMRLVVKSQGLLICYSLSNTAGPGYQMVRKLSSLKDGGG